MRFNFNQEKSTQAAAYLLALNSGDMDKYLLIKMLYLADRESLGKWEEPITGDSAVSMEYGPVLSTIYDLTKGDCPNSRMYWQRFISDSDEQTNRVFLKADPGVDALSKSETQILHGIYEKFKKFTWRQMKDYCHKLDEYEEVKKTSKPIPAAKILKAIGKTDKAIEEAEKRIRDEMITDLLLGRAW
ncbi:MAG TPA: Panacea domain-containing protein [Verrucomicrobiae bacterium]|jgi:uncharacterized phage-associated protein